VDATYLFDVYILVFFFLEKQTWYKTVLKTKLCWAINIYILTIKKILDNLQLNVDQYINPCYNFEKDKEKVSHVSFKNVSHIQIML